MKIYRKIVYYDGRVKRKYLGGIYKTVLQGSLKKYYFCGVKFYSKFNVAQELEVIGKSVGAVNNVMSAVMIANLHGRIFPEFKNIHKGKDIVLVATGPTALKYKPIEGAVHIGVNNAYRLQNAPLDYLFSMDFGPIKKNAEEIQKLEIPKFFGQDFKCFPSKFHAHGTAHIPDGFIENNKNARKFYFDASNFSSIYTDIETQPLPDLGSCVFSAACFALYTGCKRLYIVGCDCALTGYFEKSASAAHWNDEIVARLLNGWEIFGNYVKICHPNVEVISVNPVGLKGKFTDVYMEGSSC